MKIGTLFFMWMLALEVQSQGISISEGNLSPDPSALLDVQSESKGVLIPRMPLLNRDLIANPATGLLVYQTDNVPGLYMYDGSGWQVLTTSTNVWSTAGNAGTSPATAFLGTTDNTVIRFRSNNRWVGQLGGEQANVFLSDSAGIMCVGCYDNLALGRFAMKNTISGADNIAIGNKALMNNNASTNIAIGRSAMFSNQAGQQNIAIGAFALEDNTHGDHNYAVGFLALNDNNVGTANLAMGYGALRTNSIGHDNVAIGHQALYKTDIGFENTAVGNGALYQNEEGKGNAATGRSALANTYADYNTAVGFEAGYGITSGNRNVAIGAYAIHEGGATVKNTAVGIAALYSTLASYNTAIGADALGYNLFGHHNVGVGYRALENNEDGEYNTAIGFEALNWNLQGGYNIAIGPASGTHISTPNLYNTIGLGNNASLNQINNQVIIGNTAMDYIGGYEPWTVFSDARIKRDVREDVAGLDFIRRLRPVTYIRSVDAPAQITGDAPLPDFPHKYDVEKTRQTGFIAQEVEAAALASGFDFSGVTIPQHERMLYAVSYESFVVPLVKAVQEQQLIIDSQQQQIHVLEERLAIIESMLQAALPKTR